MDLISARCAHATVQRVVPRRRGVFINIPEAGGFLVFIVWLLALSSESTAHDAEWDAEGVRYITERRKLSGERLEVHKDVEERLDRYFSPTLSLLPPPIFSIVTANMQRCPLVTYWLKLSWVPMAELVSSLTQSLGLDGRTASDFCRQIHVLRDAGGDRVVRLPSTSGPARDFSAPAPMLPFSATLLTLLVETCCTSAQHRRYGSMPPFVLRTRYAMSGADVGYSATRAGWLKLGCITA
eukprot:2022506-Rhodomonas_salina.2